MMSDSTHILSTQFRQSQHVSGTVYHPCILHRGINLQRYLTPKLINNFNTPIPPLIKWSKLVLLSYTMILCLLFIECY